MTDDTVRAERDALARHIEKLIEPVTLEEVYAFNMLRDQNLPMREVLDKFIAERQRRGQMAALS